MTSENNASEMPAPPKHKHPKSLKENESFRALSADGIRLPGKDGRTYRIRLIQPSDAPLLMRGYDALPSESKWFRMLHSMPHMSEKMAVDFSTPDLETSVCTVIDGIGDLAGELVGGARILDVGPGETAEFAVTLRPEVQGLGLAYQTLEMLTGIARDAGCRAVWGTIAADNTKMLSLARKLGYSVTRDLDDPALKRAEIRFTDGPLGDGG